MNFSHLLGILRARWKLALSVFAFTVVLAVVLSLVLPKKYTGTASLVVDVKPDPITGNMYSLVVTPALIATQVDILESDRVVRRVIKDLKLDTNPAIRQQWQDETDGEGDVETWLAAAFQKHLDIKPSRDSNVITVSYQSGDPKSAAAIANAFVQAFLETSIELSTDPARQYTGFFEARAKAARDKLEAAQAKLSEYQQKNGIVGNDERLDVETARLNELASQLVALQALSAESSGRSVQAKTRGDELQEALQNPVLGGMKVDLARAEAHLKELESRYGDKHPQVQEEKANIAELRARINAETTRVVGSVGVSNNINRSREAEIRAELEAQRARVLKVKAQRDEMAVMQRDIENLQRSYDTIAQRKDQTSLESQNQQSTVNVLSTATPPMDPSSPRIVLNTVLAVFLGALLGIGTALVRELSDRRVRSSRQAIEALGVPVLGVLPRPVIKRAKAGRIGMAQRVISGRLAGPQK